MQLEKTQAYLPSHLTLSLLAMWYVYCPTQNTCQWKDACRPQLVYVKWEGEFWMHWTFAKHPNFASFMTSCQWVLKLVTAVCKYYFIQNLDDNSLQYSTRFLFPVFIKDSSTRTLIACCFLRFIGNFENHLEGYKDVVLAFYVNPKVLWLTGLC